MATKNTAEDILNELTVLLEDNQIENVTTKEPLPYIELLCTLILN